MERLWLLTIDYFFKVRSLLGGYLEPALPWLKFFGFILSLVLFVGIVYLAIASGYTTYRAEVFRDMFGVGDVGKTRQLRIWRQILRRLRSQEPTDWKLAILECDALFDEILKASGYRGETSHDRFKQLQPNMISNYERLLVAHQVRDRVRQEPDFTITRDDAMGVVKVYEQAFKELGLLE